MNTDKMIEVIRAFQSGKRIQYYTGTRWLDTLNPIWDFINQDYRVAPELSEITKKKMYQWVIWAQGDDKPSLSRNFYDSEPTGTHRAVQRADWTMIEVDARVHS